MALVSNFGRTLNSVEGHTVVHFCALRYLIALKLSFVNQMQESFYRQRQSLIWRYESEPDGGRDWKRLLAIPCAIALIPGVVNQITEIGLAYHTSLWIAFGSAIELIFGVGFILMFATVPFGSSAFLQEVRVEPQGIRLNVLCSSRVMAVRTMESELVPWRDVKSIKVERCQEGEAEFDAVVIEFHNNSRVGKRIQLPEGMGCPSSYQQIVLDRIVAVQSASKSLSAR
jgi:hypothetical protein